MQRWYTSLLARWFKVPKKIGSVRCFSCDLYITCPRCQTHQAPVRTVEKDWGHGAESGSILKHQRRRRCLGDGKVCQWKLRIFGSTKKTGYIGCFRRLWHPYQHIGTTMNKILWGCLWTKQHFKIHVTCFAQLGSFQSRLAFHPTKPRS